MTNYLLKDKKPVLDQEQERCSTWEEAEDMHEQMCQRVRETTNET